MTKLVLALGTLLFASSVFAQDGAFFNAHTETAVYFLAVALASYGGTRAQSNAASKAFEGIARNPSAADKLFVPFILGLALMESLVIFVLITKFF